MLHPIQPLPFVNDVYVDKWKPNASVPARLEEAIPMDLQTLFNNGEDGYILYESDMHIDSQAAALAYFIALIDDIEPHNIKDIGFNLITDDYITFTHPEFEFDLTLTTEQTSVNYWIVWTSISDRG